MGLLYWSSQSVEHRLSVRYCAKYFTFIISLHTYNSSRRHYTHFSDEETEGLRREIF